MGRVCSQGWMEASVRRQRVRWRLELEVAMWHEVLADITGSHPMHRRTMLKKKQHSAWDRSAR